MDLASTKGVKRKRYESLLVLFMFNLDLEYLHAIITK
jgi:hypothetical protein